MADIIVIVEVLCAFVLVALLKDWFLGLLASSFVAVAIYVVIMGILYALNIHFTFDLYLILFVADVIIFAIIHTIKYVTKS